MADILENLLIEQAEVQEKSTSKIKVIVDKIAALIDKIIDAIKNIFTKNGNMSEQEILKKQAEISLDYDIAAVKKAANDEIAEGHKLIKMISSKTGISASVVDEYCKKCTEFISKNKRKIMVGTGLAFLWLKKDVPKYKDKINQLKNSKLEDKDGMIAKVLGGMSKIYSAVGTVATSTASKLFSKSADKAVEESTIYEIGLAELEIESCVNDIIYDVDNFMHGGYHHYKKYDELPDNLEEFTESLKTIDTNFSILSNTIFSEDCFNEADNELSLKLIKLKATSEACTIDDEISLLTEAAKENKENALKTIKNTIESIIKWLEERLKLFKEYLVNSNVAKKISDITEYLKNNPDKSKEKVEIVDIVTVDKNAKAIQTKIDKLKAKFKANQEVTEAEVDEIGNDLLKAEASKSKKVTITAAVAATALAGIVSKKVIENKHKQAIAKYEKECKAVYSSRKIDEADILSISPLEKKVLRYDSMLEKLSISTYTDYLREGLTSLKIVCKKAIKKDDE